MYKISVANPLSRATRTSHKKPSGTEQSTQEPFTLFKSLCCGVFGVTGSTDSHHHDSLHMRSQGGRRRGKTNTSWGLCGIHGLNCSILMRNKCSLEVRRENVNPPKIGNFVSLHMKPISILSGLRLE